MHTKLLYVRNEGVIQDGKHYSQNPNMRQASSKQICNHPQYHIDNLQRNNANWSNPSRKIDIDRSKTHLHEIPKTQKK